jgi:hypothetical protein
MGVCQFWSFHSSEVEDFILQGWCYIRTTELNGYAFELDWIHLVCKEVWTWHLPVQRTPLCNIVLRVFFPCALLPQPYYKLGPESDNNGLVLHNCAFARALVWSTGTALPVIHIVLPSRDIRHTFPTVPIICTLYTGCPEHLQQKELEDSSLLQLYTVFMSK